MNTHASLHCSRCPAQFNCLETDAAQTHVNGHILFVPLGGEVQEPVQPVHVVPTAGIECPYCHETVEGNEDNLVQHMENCELTD